MLLYHEHDFFLAGEGFLQAFVDAEVGGARVDDKTSAAVFASDDGGRAEGVNTIACCEVEVGARHWVTSWLEHYGGVFGGVANLSAAYRDVTVCGVTMNEGSMKYEFHVKDPLRLPREGGVTQM